MNILVYQYDTLWESPSDNHLRIESALLQWFKENPQGADIVVLPEFFSTGFTMNRSLAQQIDGESVLFLRELSQRLGAALVGSVPVKENSKLYNRACFATPQGELFCYDKRHLFRMSDENEIYSSGSGRKCFQYMGWNISLNICYDLRFPVWSRNVSNHYDLMINVANWPVQRIEVARTLARARAIENQSYFIFANRSGESPFEKYNGGSMIVDYKGNDIVKGDNGKFLTAALDLEQLNGFRQKFPAWMDADEFQVQEKQ